MLVSASRRNDLSLAACLLGSVKIDSKVRDREDAVASTRDARAPRKCFDRLRVAYAVAP